MPVSRSLVAPAVAMTAVAALCATGIPTATAVRGPDGADGSASQAGATAERFGNYDARAGSAKQAASGARALVADRGSGFAAFAGSLGSQALMDFDTVTRTPRNLGRLDGFLTGRSSASAQEIALGYVRDHLTELGLTRADLDTLKLRKEYVDVAGIRHLSWEQAADGVEVFGNGLEAHVTADGRLISLQGAPVSGLQRLAKKADDTARLSAAEARAAAAKDVGGAVAGDARAGAAGQEGTSWSNGDYAKPVWFLTSGGLRLAWSTYVQAGSTLDYQHVIDAETGRVLYRRDLVQSARGDAPVFENYPGAAKGGKQRVVSLVKRGMVSKNQKYLSGPAVIAWADVNDDNVRNPRERVKVPRTKTLKKYRLKAFNDALSLCSKSFVCTWNANKAFSWRKNLRADVTQGFYFNAKFHKYLAAKPFGFTTAAGNFRGADPVLLHSLDGANTDDGFPDGNHVDNANMSTPPDGIPPTMQMYLFHAPGATAKEDPVIPTSSSFDPGIIYHEYTHGLSNRLVVDAAGNSTLNSVQAGAMGEAWSDYYAMDFLVHSKLYKDSKKKSGELILAKYIQAGKDSKWLRTQAIDCPVSTKAKPCADLTGKRGGYTYGEFPSIIGTPEVHASGEIWVQTLWDLRNRLGHRVTGMLATRAMELSPEDPTYLDMRNAILQADLAVYRGANRTAIWRTFAKRGMGFFAGTSSSADGTPAENFAMPPSPAAPRSTVTGKVVDGETGEPVANALVAITGHNSGYTGDYTAVTDASGSFTIPDVFRGRYPSVVVLAPGYERLETALRVRGGSTTVQFQPRRDWAAAEGGGAIVDFNGPDYSAFNCGPEEAIDLTQGNGWGSTTGDDAGTPTNVMIPKYIVVRLPEPVSVSTFSVDPSATCGDPGSASTGDYRIETSTDGQSWDIAAEDTFTEEDRGRFNDVSLATPAPNVRFVRFTMLSPQVPDFATNCPDGPYAGCQFTDLTELMVFGTPAG